MSQENRKDPANESRPLYLVIPAAGLGLRMGISDSKQFLKIRGVPVLARTLQAFSDFSSRTGIAVHAVLVTNRENMERARALLLEYSIGFVEAIAEGGATRQDSVASGISSLASLSCPPEKDDPVFIHDGARCMVDQQTLDRCYEGARKYDVCVAATPCKNTVKMIRPDNSSEDPLVDYTPDRECLYEVQTPQAFKYGVLTEVQSRARETGITATDDTALAEACGIPVHLISCSYENIKITTPEDVVIAESMIQNRI